MPPDWIAVSTLRRQVDKEVFDVLLELEALGWKFRKQGDKARVYCPCDTQNGGRGSAIPGTSKNPGNAAKRLRRNTEHCPENHDLMR